MSFEKMRKHILNLHSINKVSEAHMGVLHNAKKDGNQEIKEGRSNDMKFNLEANP